jgi:phage-related protein
MMESWSQEIETMMQSFIEGVERFITEVTQDIDETVDALFEVSEEVANYVQTTLESEVEPRITEFFDPLLEAYFGFGGVVERATQPVANTVEPILNEHPVCIGCRHYHGQEYNGVMFVCGMHPYGCQDEKCPDWESTWHG